MNLTVSPPSSQKKGILHTQRTKAIIQGPSSPVILRAVLRYSQRIATTCWIITKLGRREIRKATSSFTAKRLKSSRPRWDSKIFTGYSGSTTFVYFRSTARILKMESPCSRSSHMTALISLYQKSPTSQRKGKKVFLFLSKIRIQGRLWRISSKSSSRNSNQKCQIWRPHNLLTRRCKGTRIWSVTFTIRCKCTFYRNRRKILITNNIRNKKRQLRIDVKFLKRRAMAVTVKVKKPRNLSGSSWHSSTHHRLSLKEDLKANEQKIKFLRNWTSNSCRRRKIWRHWSTTTTTTRWGLFITKSSDTRVSWLSVSLRTTISLRSFRIFKICCHRSQRLCL